MVIIINSPYEIFSREVARALSHLSGEGVFIACAHRDGARPSSRDDEKSAEFIARALSHQAPEGYGILVTGCVLTTCRALSHLKVRLSELDDTIYSFRLIVPWKNMEARLLKTSEFEDAREVDGLKKIMLMQQREALGGDLGYPVEISSPLIEDMAGWIWKDITAAVEIVPYDPGWSILFRREKTRIERALGDLAIDIHHIGSTSVPLLAAKPVIDIMVSVRRLDDAMKCVNPLRRLGYIYVDYPQNQDRRFFRKGIPRSHHLHIVEEGSRSLDDHVRFRDILRVSEARRAEYQELKTALAGSFKKDRAQYSASKGSFIEKALGAACL
jgi:GrpB-like predicted nucleotidyltransferase (UPF0157 family)